MSLNPTPGTETHLAGGGFDSRPGQVRLLALEELILLEERCLQSRVADTRRLLNARLAGALLVLS